MTVAIFASAQSRQLLAGSGDPVYELNKGLLGSQLSLSASTTSIVSQSSSAQLTPSTVYPDGNIIVSADYTGQIKVFRQDSAMGTTQSRQQRYSVNTITWKNKGVYIIHPSYRYFELCGLIPVVLDLPDLHHAETQLIHPLFPPTQVKLLYPETLRSQNLPQ